MSFGNKKIIIKLKISMGVAAFPDDGAAKPMDLLELADRVLCKAKEFGGNRAYCSDDIKQLRYLSQEKKGRNPDIDYLQEKIGRLNKSANQGLVEAIFAFAKTIEFKDHCTGEHVEQTVSYATKIAETMGLSKDEILLIRQAAILHDLGKIGISEKILLKPSKLTKKEFAVIKEHPLIGADIIRPIHLLHNIVPLVMHHHERWDGKGYPSSLKGEEIPIGARIIAIADVYQALISNRPYRKALPENKAKEIIKEGAGTQFDPRIVDVFMQLI
jgi:HD-GYP domain-containing protein (c-di-GMP phosphodiesterase class II)